MASGRSAHPLRGWRDGEVYGSFQANEIFRGRVDEQTTAELVTTKATELDAYKARNEAALADAAAVRASIAAAEAGNSTYQTALAAVASSGGSPASLADLLAARAPFAALDAQLAALVSARQPGPNESTLVATVKEIKLRQTGGGGEQGGPGPHP